MSLLFLWAHLNFDSSRERLKNGARIITADCRVTFVFSHIYCSAQKRRKKFAEECEWVSLYSASFLITIAGGERDSGAQTKTRVLLRDILSLCTPRNWRV